MEIHWPVSFRHSNTTIQPIDEKTGLVDVIDVPIKDTWAAMERLVEKGKIRTIGVSNFTREKIEELSKTWVHFSLHIYRIQRLILISVRKFVPQ